MTSKSLSTEGSRGYLLDFSCENYCSMRDRQTLSLVADKSSHLAESLIDLPDQNIRVGRVAAIYGANASGKSTVLSALTGAAGIVLDSHAKWRSGQPIPLDTFALGDAKDVSASSFNFVLGGVRYHYEFSMSRERVVPASSSANNLKATMSKSRSWSARTACFSLPQHRTTTQPYKRCTVFLTGLLFGPREVYPRLGSMKNQATTWMNRYSEAYCGRQTWVLRTFVQRK
jgi:AAA domain, putative AbiEii toxin, Type IV TA system